MEIKCPHCGSELEENKHDSMVCKSCRCVFRFILVRYDTSCYNKMFKKEIHELKKEIKDGKKKKHGKRGRLRKNDKKKIDVVEEMDKIERRESLEEGKKGKTFTIGPDGEKINVSIDNPKLKKLADEAEEMIEE